jgi:leader peptidase (prepilin peptidase)/N-methyltransferase
MREILSGIFLAACAVQDLRTRKICLQIPVIAGVLALGLDAALLFRQPQALLPFLGGILPGAALLVLARLADGAAGSGDGICYLVVGALEGAWKTCLLLTAALVLSAAAGAVLLVTRRGSRKTRLPFLSFTAAAWVLLTIALQAGIQW